MGLFDYDTRMIPIITAFGHGLGVLRDIGNTEPEVMVPLEIVKYIERRQQGLWTASGITVTAVDPTAEKYPMCFHVNRGASGNLL